MFCNGKKIAIALGLFSFSTIVGIAQENPPQKNNSIATHRSLVLEDEIVQLSIFESHEFQETIVGEEEHVESAFFEAYSDHWDNQAFDPYYQEATPSNFEIAFNDTHFSPPVPHEMYVTSHYGWRHGRAHKGIDIDLEIGDTVNTILDGKVRYVGRRGGYGKIVIVRHYNGLETLYAHLSDYLVTENEMVIKGQPIGKGGVSGNARGSHLHMEVRYHGKSIHPEYLLDFENEAKIRAEKSIVTSKWMSPRLHSSRRKSTITIAQPYAFHEHISDTDEVQDLRLTQSSSDQIYIVKKGDTLYAIAHRYNMDISELCDKNEIRHNSILNIGQKILLN